MTSAPYMDICEQLSRELARARETIKAADAMREELLQWTVENDLMPDDTALIIKAYDAARGAS